MISVVLIIKKTATTILWLLLFFHFFVLFIYQMPANPISHRYKVLLEKYIHPHFSQKWSLFSPNPANSNQTIQLNFITYSKNKTGNSGWIDIVTPLLKEKNNNFWKPTQRPLKFLNSCASNIIDIRIKVMEAENKIKTKKIDTVKMEEKIKKYIRKSDGNLALLSYSKLVYGGLKNNFKTDSVLVEYRIVDAFFPRFSKRNQDYFALKNYKHTYLQSEKFRIY